MAMTDYERLKRWREKHPVLAKRRRNEAYRQSKGGTGEAAIQSAVQEVPAPPKSKIEELRALVTAESAKPAQVIEAPVVPTVRRDDYDRVITEGQWGELQRIKEEATRGGYVIDEFSQ